MLTMKRLAFFTLAALVSTTTAPAQEKLPPGTKIVKLEVAPSSIELRTPFDYRPLLVTGVRRFNRAAPERSLMLMKPTGVVPHVGGAVLTQPGEPYYELIKNWIAQGVKLDLNTPRVVKIEVSPVSTVIPLPGMKQQLTVW